jgi:general secretion pathway protein G
MFKREAIINALWILVPILALLALVWPRFMYTTIDGYPQKARAQIELLHTALDSYKSEVGDYPTTEQGLHALIVRPEGVSGWDGPYLRKDVPLDP